MRLTSLCLLPSSWHSSAGFPYPFAAIARGPLAFATRWICAADFAESIETAAVRAPLCLRFPLLLGSVQVGVGLLSPPPTPALRVHPPVLPSVAEAAAAIRLASAAASDAQRSAARPGVSPAAAAADSAGFHSRCSFVSPLDFCFRVALARSVALPLLVISAYEGLHCSCLRSTDSSPAILFEFLALVPAF